VRKDLLLISLSVVVVVVVGLLCDKGTEIGIRNGLEHRDPEPVNKLAFPVEEFWRARERSV
jgi:hypothetical protein